MKNKLSNFILYAVINFLISIILAVVLINIFNCFLLTGKITGSSMEPNFFDKDYIIMLNTKNINYDDVIVFKSSFNSNILIKRVYGLPGDIIYITNGEIYRNKEKIICHKLTVNQISQQWTLLTNQVFVIGDNWNYSYDSRKFGPISFEQIIGKVILKIKP